MSNNIVPFNFENHPVSVITDGNGEPWFVAKEVAAILDYSDAEAMTRRLDDDEKSNRQIVGLGSPTGGKGITLINESGLYSAILGSTKPEAKPFKRWVTHDVLPSIRKTGKYESPSRQSKPRHALPNPVKDLLLIAKELQKVPGVNPVLAMACAFDTIEEVTGYPLGKMNRAFPSETIEDAATLNPTDIGEELGMNARSVNKLLQDFGLQFKDEKNEWRPTESGAKHGEMKPYHNNGHSGLQLLWKKSVISVLSSELESLV